MTDVMPLRTSVMRGGAIFVSLRLCVEICGVMVTRRRSRRWMNGVAHDERHAFAYFRMRGGAIFVSLRLCVEKIFPTRQGGGRDRSRPYFGIFILQNRVRKNAQRFAFLWAIRALLHSEEGREAAGLSPLGEPEGAIRALRLSIFAKLREFLIAVFDPKSVRFRAIAAPRPCNGVPAGLQRGCRCSTVRAPLQPRGAAIATSPRLYRKTERLS